MTHIILHPNWYHHFPSIFQCSQHFPSLFPWSSASSQHLQTRSRRPVACVYSRTEEMVSSGMDSSSIRFSQKFEHPKSSPHDFSYFSLPPILSVAHMFSDNSWALIQCYRLLALTHESTIWLALHTTSWNIRKVNPNVEVSGSPDTVLSGGEPQCWDTLGALDLFFRSLQYRPTWGQPDISWFIPSHPSNYEYDISIYIMISWYVYTMYTINIHQLRRIFLFFCRFMVANILWVNSVQSRATDRAESRKTRRPPWPRSTWKRPGPGFGSTWQCVKTLYPWWTSK